MKKSWIIIVFALILMLPSNAEAACSNQEKTRLQKLASNISTSYTYREANGRIVFDVTITNMHKDLYIYDFVRRSNIYYTGQPITIYNYSNGISFDYTIKSNLNGCRGENISKIYFHLPAYNSYHKSELCNGISSYALCNKWYNTENLSYADFEKQVTAYRKSLENVKEPEEPIVEDKETIRDILIDYFFNYYYIVLIPIIIIAGGIIYLRKARDEII